NNFPVMHHLNELSKTQLVNINRWDFIQSQFLFFPGTFLVVIIGLYALLGYSAFKKYRLFFWSFFITIGVFLFLRAKDYYAIGVYPIYFAFGSVYISSLLENRVGKIIKPVLIILSVVFFVPVYNIAFPNKSPQYIVNHPDKYRKFGMLTWEDGQEHQRAEAIAGKMGREEQAKKEESVKMLTWEDGQEHQLPQDFADMLGWKELAKKVDSVYSNIPNPENTLVLCDNYGQAG